MSGFTKIQTSKRWQTVLLLWFVQCIHWPVRKCRLPDLCTSFHLKQRHLLTSHHC